MQAPGRRQLRGLYQAGAVGAGQGGRATGFVKTFQVVEGKPPTVSQLAWWRLARPCSREDDCITAARHHGAPGGEGALQGGASRERTCGRGADPGTIRAPPPSPSSRGGVGVPQFSAERKRPKRLRVRRRRSVVMMRATGRAKGRLVRSGARTRDKSSRVTGRGPSTIADQGCRFPEWGGPEIHSGASSPPLGPRGPTRSRTYALLCRVSLS